MSDSDSASSPIARYFTILDVIAAHREGATLSEIVAATGLPKPSVHRLLRSLVEIGAVTSHGDWQKSFRMGPRMWRMLQLGANPETVSGYAQIVVSDLAAELGETAYIVRYDGERVVSIAQGVSETGHRFHVVPGDALPFHAAAVSKSILASHDDAVIARHIEVPLDRLTSRTKTDPEAVRAEIEEVRQQGYALCDGEIDEELMAYGCPVEIPGAGAAYAVGVTGLISRMSRRPAEDWVVPMQAAAKRFGRMLGGLARG